jgi:DinB superfamily
VEWRELIVDGYDRLPEMLEDVLRGLRPADLDWQPHPDCNSIGWTTWHLIRVQDGQIADLMGEP